MISVEGIWSQINFKLAAKTSKVEILFLPDRFKEVQKLINNS